MLKNPTWWTASVPLGLDTSAFTINIQGQDFVCVDFGSFWLLDDYYYSCQSKIIHNSVIFTDFDLKFDVAVAKSSPMHNDINRFSWGMLNYPGRYI